jgi:hypothetical protein
MQGLAGPDEPGREVGFLGRGTHEPITPERLEQVLLEVASGETLAKAAAAAGMSRMSFWNWCLKERWVAEAWRIARRLQAQSLFDRAMEVVGRLEGEKWKPADAVQVRALDSAARWFLFAAARLNPSDFGEQQAKTPPVTVEITTTLGVGVRVGPDTAPASTYTLTVQPAAVEGEEGQSPSVASTGSGGGQRARPAHPGQHGKRRGMGGSSELTSPDMGPKGRVW